MHGLNRSGLKQLSKPPAKGIAEHFFSDWSHLMFPDSLLISYWQKPSPTSLKVGNQIK